MGNQLETLSRSVITFCGLTVGWQSQEMPMLKAKFYLNWNVSLS